MLEQLDLECRTKPEAAIALIQEYEPPEGYWVAFSYGKDSSVVYDLTIKAGAKHQAYYNRTGIDPPELVQFGREYYPEVIPIKPVMTIWEGILYHGLPTRKVRWCCQVLKEHAGNGRLIISGIRAQESAGRRSRSEYYEYDGKKAKQKYIKDKTFLLPILRWSKDEVWQYIRENNIPYCSLYDLEAERKGYGEGLFKRLGCVLCPCNSKRELEMERYPKIAAAWERAARRYFESGKMGMDFSTFEEYWNWWLNPPK